MLKNLKYIATLDRKGTYRVIGWEVLHSLFIAAPSGILLIIVRELFAEHPDVDKVWRVVALMLILLLLQFMVASKAMVTSNLWVYGLANKLRIKLGNRIQRFSLGFFKKRDPGDIAAVLLQDVANFEGIFGHSVGNITAALCGTLLLSCFLFVYDWRLTLCLLAALPLVYPFLLIAQYFVRKLGRKQIAARNAVGAKFLEYIQGIRHLKSYGQVGDRNDRLNQAFDDLRKKSIRMEAIPGPFILTAGIVFEIGFILMIALGVFYLTTQEISIPVLITFLILGYNLYQPLKVIMVDYVILQYMNESLVRIIDVLELPTMETGTAALPDACDIVFEAVTFGYQGQPTVCDLNFTVPAASMTALVGHSGSGKTTIASLIARFWDVDTGAIRIGGIDVRAISQDVFYGMISEVFQDVYLFDDSIYNNIKIGKPDASEMEIIEAADKAQVLEFAWELKQGMHTRVGEGGSRLSGGQKQRVSIARALLKNAPIVLLDEATASLDPENEFFIQQAIQELVKEKTVMVIAHKLATIQQADQILVLDKGKIVERGTHEQLLIQGKTYSHMWALQQQSKGWRV